MGETAPAIPPRVQVRTRDAVAHGDFLRTQALGDGFRPPGASLHRGIARDDDRVAAFDLADAGDRAEARRLTIVLIVGQQQPDFEEGRARVEQRRNALARGHFARAMLALDLGRSAARAPAALRLLPAV